ncbi:MAG: recombinase family protein [Thermoplasmata archaeon]
MDTLFLPFASRKEFLKHYRAEDTTMALRRWAAKHGLSPSAGSTRLLSDDGAIAFYGRQALHDMRPGQRTAPYGYTRREEGLVREDGEARAILAFFRMYDEGMSLRQVAEAANRQRVPTSRGGRWQASTIRHILRNPVYIGRVRRKNMVRGGGPPALIDSTLFEAVQRGLTRRAKRASKAMRRVPSSPPV